MYAKVVVDVKASNVDVMFTYHIPEELEDYVFIGSRVFVPFGVRNIMGYVLEITGECDYDGTVKDLIDVLDFSKEITPEQIELAVSISKKTRCLLTQAIDLMYPSFFKNKYRKFITYKNLNDLDANVALLFGEKKKVLLTKEMVKENPKIKKEIEKGNLILEHDVFYYGKRKKVKYYSVNPITNETYMKLSKVGKRVYDYIMDKKEATVDEIRDGVNCSGAIIDNLTKKGILSLEEKLYVKEENIISRVLNKNVTFTSKQKEIKEKFDALNSKPFLFYSNDENFKYEFYLEIIKDTILSGKNVLVMTPILLANYNIYNYLKRNLEGYKIINFSSDINNSEFYNNYMDVKTGNCDVVVTTKVGTFVPLENIGLIIVLEEDNMNYLSEMTPKYNVIDVLTERAKYHGAKLLLSSNTPKIETYNKYQNAKYYLLKYRVNNNCNIDLVQMKDEVLENNDIISSVLDRRIKDAFYREKQVMLILDSKGYSQTIKCRKCKTVLKCPKCNISLSYYKEANEARCRYCGQKFTDFACGCGSKDFILDNYGLEQVKEKLNKMYPDKKVLVVDSDTLKNNEDYQNIVYMIESGEADFIIGTSNITSLTTYSSIDLIGLLNVDKILSFSDYKASYNAFSLISKSLVYNNLVIQGFNLDHYSIKYGVEDDFVGFYNEEIEVRKALNYPPFVEINKIIITGEYKEMYHAANYIKKVLPIICDGVCLGPVYDKIRKGVQLIIKHNNYEKLFKLLDEVAKKFSDSNLYFNYERYPRSL